MTRELWRHDPMTGVTIWWEDTADGFLLHYEQDTEPTLDLNHAKEMEGRSYYAADPDMWKVASIPLGVLTDWKLTHGLDINDPEQAQRLVRLLNDADYRRLKTADITI